MFMSFVQECEVVMTYWERFYHTWDQRAAFHSHLSHPLWKVLGLATGEGLSALPPSQMRTSRWWPPRKSWRWICPVYFVWEGGMLAMLGHIWGRQGWMQPSVIKMFPKFFFNFNLTLLYQPKLLVFLIDNFRHFNFVIVSKSRFGYAATWNIATFYVVDRRELVF